MRVYRLTIAVACLLLLASSASSAAVPTGVWLFRDGVTALVVKMSFAELASFGVISPPITPDALQIVVKGDTEVTAYSVTVRYKRRLPDGSTASETKRDFADASPYSGYALIQIPVSGSVRDVDIESITVRAYRETSSTEIQ